MIGFYGFTILPFAFTLPSFRASEMTRNLKQPIDGISLPLASSFYLNINRKSDPLVGKFVHSFL